ncbi:lipopolysaccharide biosynthesis protein [Allopontixanthobacter sediminis]|nr:lipopolysaccharide biosynthesis protein [Allopontixanthobacter sediminis]
MVTQSPLTRLRASILSGEGLRTIRWRSVLHLMSGSAGNAAIMLLATLLAARTLEPEQYGVMVLILAIGRVCERLLRFESWQPLVRFVAEEEHVGTPDKIARLYLFGLLLDVSSAVTASALAIAFGLLFAGLVGLDSDNSWLIVIYACAIAVNIRGMPSAALRLGGRFKTLAYIQLFANSLRLVLAAACFLADAGVIVFIAVWTAAQILDSLLFLYCGFRALGKSGIPNPLRSSPRGLRKEFPGFLGFAFSTNLSSMVRTLTHEMDTLLVGAFAGPAMAGLYNLAKRIAKMAQQIADLIQTVVYPDLSRLWSKRSTPEFRQAVVGLQFLLLVVCLTVFVLILVAGQPLIILAFGQGYAGIYPLLLAQIVAVAFTMHSAPSRSALLAMNKPRAVLLVSVASSAAFFVAAFLLMPAMGALGANVAHIVGGALAAILFDVLIWRRIGKESSKDEPEEGSAE